MKTSLQSEPKTAADTVRDVLEERLSSLLQQRIGNLLAVQCGKEAAGCIISELTRELADEAVSALGIRESELDELWDGDEEFDEFPEDIFVTPDQGRIFWTDDSVSSFPLNTIEREPAEACESFEELVTQVLKHFPERNREEIKEIWIGDDFWTMEKGILTDTITLPF